jgi:hypothetical protein
MVKKISNSAVFLLFFSNIAFGQTIITGTVKDVKGVPIPGASVLPKDAKKGTSTNTLGVFTIETNPEGFLTITAVGLPIQPYQ